jgi:hypothetical protein
MAVALTTGAVIVSPMTVKQAAAVMKVPLAEVGAAHAQLTGGNGKANGTVETLADHIRRASAAERLEAAKEVGVGFVWEELICPILASDRPDDGIGVSDGAVHHDHGGNGPRQAAG